MEIIQPRVRNIYRSKTDLVASAIKEMIHSGELESGSTLRQREVADLLGVSPTPVREALRRLEAEGFVVYSDHSSAAVVRSEDAALYENALIRAALESLGTELATAKATVDDVDRLDAINEQYANSHEEEEIVDLNREFHFAVYEIADLPVLTSQLNLLWRSLDGGPRVDRPLSESVEQHRQILDAIRSGDALVAGRLVRAHILDAATAPNSEQLPSS